MTGSDAALWHMEDENTPLHTLKVVILDTKRHGRPLTLAELGVVIGSRLGLIPRATQKVVAAPGFGGRPFWVSDPDFDLSRHLHECTLPAPTARDLERLYSGLASSFLPRDRSPWDITLVHGLEGERQAVVVRVHHAIVDGLGALNTLLAVSSDEPGPGIGLNPAPIAGPIPMSELVKSAAADTARTWRHLPSLAREIASARRAGHADPDPDIPSFRNDGRTSLNASGGHERTCAAGSLDLATVRMIGKATGATVNGVLHAVIAGALRSELAARGEDTSTSLLGAFGIASDTADSERLYGNFITPTFVRLRSDVADPVERLVATARSCRVAVEARRNAGLDITDHFSAHAPRLLNRLRRTLARHTTMAPAHVVTANVAGPKQRRWISDIEVVDWFSFAVAMNPVSINITVHSYDGRMNVGIVADPVALPEPQILVGRMHDELAVLAGAVLGDQPALRQVAA